MEQNENKVLKTSRLSVFNNQLLELNNILSRKKLELEEIQLRFEEKEAKLEILLKQKDERISQLEKMIDESRNFALIKELQTKLEECEAKLAEAKKKELQFTKSNGLERASFRRTTLNPVNVKAFEKKKTLMFDPDVKESLKENLEEISSNDLIDRRDLIDHLREEIGKSENEKEKLKEENEDFQEQIINLQDQKLKLEKKVIALEGENIRFLEELEKQKTISIDLETQVAKLKIETEKKEILNSEDVISPLKFEIGELKSQIKKEQLEKERLLKEISNLKSSKEQREADMMELSTKYSKLKDDLEKAKLHIERESVIKRTDEINMKNKFEESVLQYETKIENLEKELASRRISRKSMQGPNIFAKKQGNTGDGDGADKATKPPEPLDLEDEFQFMTTDFNENVPISDPLFEQEDKKLTAEEKFLEEIEQKNAEISKLRKELIQAIEKAEKSTQNYDLESLKLALKHAEESNVLNSELLENQKDFYQKKIRELQEQIIRIKQHHIEDVCEMDSLEKKYRQVVKLLDTKVKDYEEQITDFNKSQVSLRSFKSI